MQVSKIISREERETDELCRVTYCDIMGVRVCQQYVIGQGWIVSLIHFLFKFDIGY